MPATRRCWRRWSVPSYRRNAVHLSQVDGIFVVHRAFPGKAALIFRKK